MATRFREYTTKQGTLILAGRDAVTNEELIEQVEPNETVLHTREPGSPFVNIKGEPNAEDVKEAAVFCAAHSRAWKKNKIDIEIHKFKGHDIYKEKGMSLGTFGIKSFKVITIKKREIEGFLNEKEKGD
ncbi:MAG: NFACT RNA binding domain-containing protein [Nanoarchaeota archaeon]